MPEKQLDFVEMPEELDVFSEEMADSASRAMSEENEALAEDFPLEEAELAETEQATDEMLAELDTLHELTAQNDEFTENPPEAPPPKPLWRLGLPAAGASLVFMGIVLAVSLGRPRGVLEAFRLSPVILIFLGVELIAAFVLVLCRKVELRAVGAGFGACFGIILVCCALAMVSVSLTDSGLSRELLEKRYTEELQNALYSGLADIHEVGVTVELYGESAAYGGLESIEESDRLEAYIKLAVPGSLMDFAADCRAALDVLEGLPVSFGEILLEADDGRNMLFVRLSGKLHMGLSAEEIAHMTYYFIDEAIELDLADLQEEK